MKLHPVLLLLCLLALLPARLGAQGASSTPTNPSISPPAAPQAAPIIPAAPQIEAKGYLLVDFNTGAVLAESNADLRLEPASLTKIMTGYTLYTCYRHKLRYYGW